MSSPTASRRSASPRSELFGRVTSNRSSRSGRLSDISERGRRRSSFASDRDRDGRPSFISGRPSIHDDLEQHQSREERGRRRESEGAEAVLSEIAVPPPVEWQELEWRRGSTARGDEHEIKLRRASAYHSSHEAFLSEVVSPPPIERERTKSYSRIHPSREEESVTPEESPSPLAERLDGSIPLSDPTTTEDLERRPSNIRRRRRTSSGTKLYVISYLTLFSMLGTLARLGLQALNFYAGAPVKFNLLWPNFGGSLIMGFLIEDRNLFREEWGAFRPVLSAAEHSKGSIAALENAHRGVKKTIPLYIGLATGFCGSLTSFSAFMRDAFLALSNDLPSPISHPMPSRLPSPSSTVPRNGGYSFLALLAVIITTISLSLAAFFFGAHIALAIDRITPTLPFRFVRRFVDPAVVFLAFGSWLGAVIMAILPPDRFSHSPETWRGQTLFALVFAPLGCLLRFYASILLNGRFPSFPLGTFTVNIFGTMVEGMVFDLQHSSVAGALASSTQGNARPSYHSLITCQLLQGVGDGFCGCLTTVSAWVAELRGLTRYNGYVYGIVTLVVALGFMVVEMGTFRWKVGFGEPVCTG
jgi:CrcB protein